MKLSSTWRSEFDSRDLARGEAYYYQGAVHNLKLTEDGWTARVYGSTTYSTFVSGDPYDPYAMTCDCPRFEAGYLCKHLAATCLAIEAGDAAKTAAPLATDNLAELVASIPEADARAFLLAALQRDNELATGFAHRFGAVDAKAACKTMAKQLSMAVWDYTDNGFIDWRGALGFERRYREIVHTNIDPLVARDAVASAFDLSIQALRSLQSIEIDDSDGFFGSIIDDVEGMWEHWLGTSEESDSHLFDGISNYLAHEPAKPDEREIYSYAAEMARDFLTKHFIERKDYSERFVALADKEIAREQAAYGKTLQFLAQTRAGLKAADTLRGRSYAQVQQLEREHNTLEFYLRGHDQQIARWVLIRLRALRAGGMDEAALREEAGSHIVRENVCQFFVDRALEQHDTSRAVELLQDCKRQQQSQSGGEYSLKVSERLVDLLGDSDVDALREELLNLMCRTPYVGQAKSVRDLWARLRESYDEAEWLDTRDEMLDRVTRKQSWRDCLAAEGLYDRLMDDIECEGVTALCYYEEELVGHCPERVLRLYLDDLEHNRAYPGDTRKSYQHFAQHLLHVKALPGGEAPVTAIVAQMRERYPRRPALMDELSVVL